MHARRDDMDGNDADTGRVLAALAEIADKVTATLGLLTSVDAKVTRLLAALDRLEGPVVLDAGHEVDGTTVH